MEFRDRAIRLVVDGLRNPGISIAAIITYVRLNCNRESPRH